MTIRTAAWRRWTLLGGLALGLVLRVLTLGYRGSFDLNDYQRWGNAALDSGLARGYDGIYFPVAYQIFEACAWIAHRFGLNEIVVLKAANLPFDLIACLLLIAILKRTGLSPLYGLVYWLHPWFLVVFGLGYVDCQFSCALVMTLWLLQRGPLSPRGYLAAGIPLGIALLMKPQVVLLAVALSIYAAQRWRVRRVAAWWLLVPAAALGALYELYFVVALWGARGWRASMVLPVSYIRTGSVMPVLTADMLNVWYPIAWWLKAPGAEIWTVGSKLDVLPHVQVRFAALLFVLAAMAWYTVRAARSRRPMGEPERIRWTLTFAALIVPVAMTSAHENHLFAATLLCVPLLAAARPLVLRAAIHGVLLLQVVNLEGIYGVDRFARWLRPFYVDNARLMLSIVAIACYAVLIRELVRRVGPPPDGPAAILEAAGG